uniref:Uncharacterized protein n=1 Tax=Cacopsylla melanoneura TaxID=428564 RepID=A0A8D9BUV7_9HEMI
MKSYILQSQILSLPSLELQLTCEDNQISYLIRLQIVQIMSLVVWDFVQRLFRYANFTFLVETSIYTTNFSFLERKFKRNLSFGQHKWTSFRIYIRINFTLVETLMSIYTRQTFRL